MEKLTIIMPTYNSISRNGDGFLQQALESLLAQTYKEFKLHILDNISEDNTFDVCKSYADKDKRIKLEMDTEQRFPEGAITKLAYEVKTPYLMVANCDDLWNHYYIENLMSWHKLNKEIDAIYSNGNYININNHVGTTLIPNTKFTYNNNIDLNFCFAVEHRNVVPTLFGIFKTEAYQSALPYVPFDNLKANVDNVFLLRFLLNGNKALLCNKDLFYYRNRHRKFDGSKISDMPESPILIWTYYIRHHLKFYKTIEKYLPEDNNLMKLVLFDSMLRCIPNNIRWILRDVKMNKFEEGILISLYERYKEINT